MTSTNTSSPLISAFDSSNSLHFLGQTSTSHGQSPWNQAQPFSEEYSPGYVAFAPSPKPSQASSTTSPSRALTHTRNSKKKAAPAETPPENKWIFVTEGAADPDLPTTPRTGVRRGQLPAKSRKKARRIREIGACWKCWVQKVPCSEGLPCETCAKHFLVLAPQMCCRTRLHEYVPVFFPGMFSVLMCCRRKLILGWKRLSA